MVKQTQAGYQGNFVQIHREGYVNLTLNKGKSQQPNKCRANYLGGDNNIIMGSVPVSDQPTHWRVLKLIRNHIN